MCKVLSVGIIRGIGQNLGLLYVFFLFLEWTTKFLIKKIFRLQVLKIVNGRLNVPYLRSNRSWESRLQAKNRRAPEFKHPVVMFEHICSHPFQAKDQKARVRTLSNRIRMCLFRAFQANFGRAPEFERSTGTSKCAYSELSKQIFREHQSLSIQWAHSNMFVEFEHLVGTFEHVCSEFSSHF